MLISIVGIVIFFVGILLSVAWHELGHFIAARRFGIKVPEFFVGFGRTIWSVRRGETEYGIKAIPLGGYIRMIGMLPPAKGGTLGRNRRTGPFQGLVDDARAQSASEVTPEDADRQFWTRSPWKRIIVMFAGPFMNLILAVVIFAVVLMGIGKLAGGTKVSAVSECVVPATVTQQAQCPPGAPPTPAAAAGILPGDSIVAFDGREYGPNDGDQLRDAIRDARGTLTITVDRGGQRIDLPITVVENQVENPDDPRTTVTAGFLGVSLLNGDYVRQSPAGVADQLGFVLSRTGEAIVALPQRIPALFGAAFLGQERSLDSPVGIVGASRLGGEILAADEPWRAELSFFLGLLASVNISLFLFNLLPIPPLDGGQIFPAIWEAIKRNTARLLGRPDPGPVDAARLLPFAMVVVAVFLVFSGMMLIANIVNPVRLTG